MAARLPLALQLLSATARCSSRSLSFGNARRIATVASQSDLFRRAFVQPKLVADDRSAFVRDQCVGTQDWRCAPAVCFSPWYRLAALTTHGWVPSNRARGQHSRLLWHSIDAWPRCRQKLWSWRPDCTGWCHTHGPHQLLTGTVCNHGCARCHWVPPCSQFAAHSLDIDDVARQLKDNVVGMDEPNGVKVGAPIRCSAYCLAQKGA